MYDDVGLDRRHGILLPTRSASGAQCGRHRHRGNIGVGAEHRVAHQPLEADVCCRHPTNRTREFLASVLLAVGIVRDMGSACAAGSDAVAIGQDVFATVAQVLDESSAPIGALADMAAFPEHGAPPSRPEPALTIN